MQAQSPIAGNAEMNFCVMKVEWFEIMAGYTNNDRNVCSAHNCLFPWWCALSHSLALLSIGYFREYTDLMV
jgi:hypothetical protein